MGCYRLSFSILKNELGSTIEVLLNSRGSLQYEFHHHSSFESRFKITARALRIKRDIFEQKDGIDECALDFLYKLFATQDAYVKSKSVFTSSSKEQNQTRISPYNSSSWGTYCSQESRRSQHELLQFSGAN